MAIPSGAGVALSVLGGNAGSLVGETIHLIYIRFLTDLAAPKELQYTTIRNNVETGLSFPSLSHTIFRCKLKMATVAKPYAP